VAKNWEGQTSDHLWEQQALDHVRELLPEVSGYWALQSFSFTSRTGRTRECDLFVATPGGLHLIEIKSHPGKASNSGTTWYFERGRPLQNPQWLVEQKAKELKGLLEYQAQKAGKKLPKLFITASVFLSAPDLDCRFDEQQKHNVYGRQGVKTGLPGIWSGLLGKPTANRRLSPGEVNLIAQLMRQSSMGIPKRELTVGDYQFERVPLEEGPTWRDHIARHTSLPDELRRVRVYIAQGETVEEREGVRKAARREYQSLRGIRHPAIVDAETFSEQLDLGPAIVFEHGADWIRLDQFIKERGADLDIDTRIFMIRQLADALQHAHGHRLYHRSLAARSVYVKMDGRYPRLHITDWQAASRAASTTNAGSPSETTMGSLAPHLESAAALYLAPEVGDTSADKAQLDVFGLGAIAYLIMSGRAPASSRRVLLERLQGEECLNLQSQIDGVPNEVADLVAFATSRDVTTRFESARAFSESLDKVEASLTTADDPDPLEAKAGDSFDRFKVKKVLGTGGTGRALLVDDGRAERVLKVALDAEAATRLEMEAAELHGCKLPQIVEAYGDPIDLPKGRKGLLLEYAGETTLGQLLRTEGQLPIPTLQNLGEDLFYILQFLERTETRHRDIKPDNLGLKRLKAKGRDHLILFDFSLAGVADTDLEVGTSGYRDPFLGEDGRLRFDDDAERYSVAATLYAMATTEVPAWGDGDTETAAGTRETTPRLALDLFEDSIREGLTEFFKKALHRDAEQRFGSTLDMQEAFRKIFRASEPEPAAVVPVKSDHPVGLQTPLVEIGLDEKALSVAHLRLRVETVGELIDLPTARINNLRGVGSKPKRELVKAAGHWRRELRKPEPLSDGPDEDAEGTGRRGVDAIAARLIGERNKDEDYVNAMSLFYGLTPEQVMGEEPLWLTNIEVERQTGIDPDTLEDYLAIAARRLLKSKWGFKEVRDDVVNLLKEHGRIMPVEALADALLAARGAAIDGSIERHARAAACVRAVFHAEASLKDPRIEVVNGRGSTWLAALVSTDFDEPSDNELREWAQRLGEAAENLVADVAAGNPLPTVERARNVLATIKPFEDTPVLSDRDLFELAAGATDKVGVSARLELYPLDLDPGRAVRIVGLASRLRAGITAAEVVNQVKRRFPQLQQLPEPTAGAAIERLLRDSGLEILRDGNVLKLQVDDRTSTKIGPIEEPVATPAEIVEARLTIAANTGGFLALTATHEAAPGAVEAIAARSGVTAIDVARLYMAKLHQAQESLAEQRGGRPDWSDVLEADRTDARPQARTGLATLSEPAWDALRSQVLEAEGVVFLHDAAPLARIEGGMDLLRGLVAAARHKSKPHALWLMCPMKNPERDATLDGQGVGALRVDNEQLTIPASFVAEI
jgi:serine/threonine protein kinase